MNRHLISTLVSKDLSLYFRNRFFALVTILALVFYAVIYYLLPSNIDESLEIGLYAPGMPATFLDQLESNDEALVIHEAPSEDALRQAIIDNEYGAGFVFPEDTLEQAAGGEMPEVRVYFNNVFPEELREAYEILLREIAYSLTGQQLQIEVTSEVLGVDTAGNPIAYRDRLLPLMAIFILMVETLGLATLISSEIEQRTISALLVTPLNIEGLFVGKGISGTSLAFAQVLFLITVTGGLRNQPEIILLTLLIGSVLVTGMGFLLASAARDLMSVMAWGILLILLLSIPAFAVLFPGFVSDWVMLIPSYYLVDTVFQVITFDAGWQEVGGNLLILLAFTALFIALGVFTLRRKFR